MGFLASAKSQGLGVTAARNLGRSQFGLSYSNETYSSAWAQLQQLAEASPLVASAPTSRQPIGAEVTPVVSKAEGGYLYRFQTFVRQRGERGVIAKYLTVKSPNLITYDAAMAQIADSFDTGALPIDQGGSGYSNTLISIVPTSVSLLAGGLG